MKRHLIAAALATAAGCSQPAPPPTSPPTTDTVPAPPDTAPTSAVTAPPVARTAPAAAAPTTTAVVAAPPPTSPPDVGGAALGDVETAICAAWGDECGRALRVARCESGLRPAARNGPHAGLFQVNVRIHAARIARMGFTVAQMYEAGPNIAVAHALWSEQGWRPWTCAA